MANRPEFPESERPEFPELTLAQLDITQTALRDAITSPSPNARTLADLYAELASILGQLNLTTTALRDAVTGASPSSKTLFALDQDLVAALQATQPRSVTNFPTDYPDAVAEARLMSILNQLNIPLTTHRDAITGAVAADQPRHITNFPADYPDALAETRLASVLGQLDIKTSQVRDGIAGAGVSTKTLFGLDQDLVAAIQATQPRSVTNFPSDFPDAVAQARLLSLLGQLNITLSAHRDAITAALATDQPRHVTNFPTDYPDATSVTRLQSIITQLDRTLSEVFDVKAAQNAVTAGANSAGLTVTLDLGTTGRATVQRVISVGAAATVLVQASRDNATWRTLETQTFAVATTNIAAVQGLGYRYVRVTSANTGVALEFEISGTR